MTALARAAVVCLALSVASAAGCASRTLATAQSSDGSSGSGQGRDGGGDVTDPTDVPEYEEVDDERRYDIFDPAPLGGVIGTGRPSFGTGTSPVPVGHLQVESGYLYTENDDDKTHTFPNVLLRYGVYDGIELRASTAGVVIPEGGDAGTTDLRFGAKLAIRGQNGIVPALAFQPSFTVPTGSASTADQADPQVQFPVAWTVGDGLTILGNLNLGTASISAGPVDGGTRPVFAHSLLVGYDVVPRLTVFAEYFGVDTEDARETYNADFGALFLLNDNNQIDFIIGFGLNDQADDFFVGAGYSFRI